MLGGNINLPIIVTKYIGIITVLIMNKTRNDVNIGKDESYKNAHLFSELAKIFQHIGDDIEKSVAFFDSIGEKDDTFKKLEQSVVPPLETFIKINDESQKAIMECIFSTFYDTFNSNKEEFNFVHATFTDKKSIIFFLSVKNQDVKDELLNLEFEYALTDLSEYMDVSFCFVDSDMENKLTNTNKIEFEHV